MDEAQPIEGYEEEIADEAALQAPETGSRLGGATAILLVMFGFAVDALEIFLDLILIGVVLNWIVGFFAGLTIYLCLQMRGISFWEAKRGVKILGSMFAAIGLEILTLGAAPGWGLWTLYLVISERSRNMPVVKKTEK